MNRCSILNEDGSIEEEYSELLPDEDLIKILKLIIYNRVFDNRMLLLQRQGRLGFYLTSTGEEAVTIGSAYPLSDEDPIFISYRELGALLWRGVPPAMILNQLIGNEHDAIKGRQMPVHYSFKDYAIPSVSSPVGTQLSHACGAAYAYQLQNKGLITMAFFGEGTASTGEFHSGLNFSGTLNAPVVFILRNNGYSISTPESKQSNCKDLSQRAQAYGIDGTQVDGNDLFAVIHSVNQAVDKARNGDGPSLIEMQTYRQGAHSSSDEPSKYRANTEEEAWKKVDCLVRLKRHAIWKGIWNEDESKAYEKEADDSITHLIHNSSAYLPPAVATIFDDVYEVIPNALLQQKEEYLLYLKNKEVRNG